MKTRLENRYIIAILQVVVSVIPFFLDHTSALSYGPYNYAIAQGLSFLLLISIPKDDRNLFLLSPSFIATSYLNINFLIGSIAFGTGSVFKDLLLQYSQWDSFAISMAYFNLANVAIIHAFFLSRPFGFKKVKTIFNFQKLSTTVLIFIGLAMIITFSIFGIDLSFFSSSPADYYIIPKSLGAILIFVAIFRRFSLPKRLISYAVVIFVFALAAFEDKRDAIFLLLPIVLLESVRNNFKVTLRQMTLGALSAIFLIYLIIVMSILRGYGGYNADGFLDATSYVDDYVQSDVFIPAFMNNIEVSYTFFHSNNAIEHILDDESKLTYGSTIIKPVFIIVPRAYFPQKPASIIELYTTSFSPEMRARGVSWPVSFQSEMFWNFHFFGIFFGGAFFFIFNCVYRNIVQLIRDDRVINFVPLLYIYQQSLVLFRGSGLDQYAVDIIFSFFVFTAIQFLVGLLVPRAKPRVEF